MRNRRRLLAAALTMVACGGAVAGLRSWADGRTGGMTARANAVGISSVRPAAAAEPDLAIHADRRIAIPVRAVKTVFEDNDFSGFVPKSRAAGAFGRAERLAAARQRAATRQRHLPNRLAAAASASADGSPSVHEDATATRLPPRPLERSTPSTMELRKREDLAFHFDPSQFPNGLRIANTSGDPAVISFHGPAASRVMINGVQARENVDYSMDQELDIHGPDQVGVHIRSGTGTTPAGPAGNG